MVLITHLYASFTANTYTWLRYLALPCAIPILTLIISSSSRAAARGRARRAPMSAATSARTSTNSENKYGHNFVGKYCRCDRGQDGELGEMFQCVLCEDWFHEKCLNISSRAAKELENVACELVCANCSDNIPLLDAYHARHGLFRRDGNTSGDMNINMNMNIAHDPDVCIRPPKKLRRLKKKKKKKKKRPSYRRPS